MPYTISLNHSNLKLLKRCEQTNSNGTGAPEQLEECVLLRCLCARGRGFESQPYYFCPICFFNNFSFFINALFNTIPKPIKKK